jgi:hypothetical protein
MSGPDQRQSLRLIRQIPCALRAKPEQTRGITEASTPALMAVDRLESLANEFEGYCEQISHRPTLNALRTLQRQVDHLQSTVTTNLAQQASWTQDMQTRRMSLSFDGLEIEVLHSDNLTTQPALLEVLFNLPGLPSVICTLKVMGFSINSIVGTFQQIGDADLRRLRRYVLLQDAASTQSHARVQP